MSATTPHMVERWRMEGRELVYVGTRRAPRPRAAVVQEDVLDPPEHLHREPTMIGAGGSREP